MPYDSVTLTVSLPWHIPLSIESYYSSLCTIIFGSTYQDSSNTNFDLISPVSGNYIPYGNSTWKGASQFRTNVKLTSVKPSDVNPIFTVGTMFTPNWNSKITNGGISLIDPSGNVQFDFCALTLSTLGMKGTIVALGINKPLLFLTLSILIPLEFMVVVS